MRHLKIFATILTAALLLTACGSAAGIQKNDPITSYEGVEINLSDEGITVDQKPVGTNEEEAVYIANDIVYYESGKDFTYGEGTEKDAHTPEEAAAHTVVHITKAGTYVLNGELSRGQIAVDLGEDAEEDPKAVVTLVLNGVDVTCEVAPAVIFYNVYECGDTDADSAKKDVDTSAAGANVIIADGTQNTINGSYVERIYKPGSVVLNDDKTEVEDAKKLHKYDGAFYSKMSMNINGGEKNSGVLTINAENEGLDSELHLTINGGNININSGNDGINTNEDGVSVTTMNGGVLTITVTGETGEGDGIDSNGWLVINGGTVVAAACSSSADAGIDSDMGIHINGGTVVATGHMLDTIEDGGQTYAVFQFAQSQDGKAVISLQNAKGNAVMEHTPGNAYSVLVCSSPELKEGTYTLWSDGKQMAGQSGGMFGGFGMPGGMMPGGELPEGFEFGGEMPEGFEFGGELPEGFEFGGELPEDFEFGGEWPEGFEFGGELPEGFEFDGEWPEGFEPGGNAPSGSTSPEFPQKPSQGESQQQPPNGKYSPQKLANVQGNSRGNRPSFGGEQSKGMGGFGRPGNGGGMWQPGNNGGEAQEFTAEFEIVEGGNVFSNVSYLSESEIL